MIIHFIFSIIAILITSYLIPGSSITLLGAVVLAVVLGVINIFIKPVIKLITLPINILTLGLFSLVVNALFIILSSKLVPDFQISGFWTAFWFSIVLSFVNMFFGVFNNKKD